MAVFFVTTDAWRLNLYSPISYWGDALEMPAYSGSDYVFNDLRERFFAPFGVERASPLRYVRNFLFQPNSTLYLIAYSVTRDVIASLNLYYLLTFPLAFISAYWVYSRLKLPNPFRFGAATLFALMPYHFQRGVGHLMESSYFLVPLLAYIVLLVFRERPYFHSYRNGAWRWSWKEKQDWFFLGVTVFLSQISEYHHFFFVMLLGVATLIASVQRKSYRVLAGGATLLGATLLSTVAKIVLNHLVAEPGLELSLIGTPISGYGDAEIYALKIIQVILPVAGHHLESFRALRAIYNASHAVNENGTVALGLFGAMGFLFLVVRSVYAIVAKRQAGRILDLCAFLTLCCVLIATVGGAGSIIATAGNILFGPESLLTQVRGYNRIVVFIAFFSYYAGSVLLWRFACRASAYARGRFAAKAIATIVWLLIFVPAVWDQVPFQETNSKDGSVRHASDKNFFSQIEAQLPPRALIFQYPFNIHHTDVNGSEHLPYNYADGIRPYLNSRTLRFTYGADNGSAQVKWLQEMSSLPPEQMVKRLCQYGFSGIIVHRHLFRAPEEATQFEASLSAAVESPLEESTDKDFSFAPLAAFCARNRIPKLDLGIERGRWLQKASDNSAGVQVGAKPATHLQITPGPDTSHTVGKFDPVTNTMVAERGQKGVLLYGPYARLEPGHYLATFVITAEADADDSDVGTVDVNEYTGSKPNPSLASAALKAGAGAQTIKLNFTIYDSKTSTYEFRVFVNGLGRISVHGVQVQKL